MYKVENIQEYTIGISQAYPYIDHQHIISLISTPKEQAKRILGGRGVVGYGALPNIGPVVIKQYHRGGLLGKINKSTYLRLAKCRPAQEFEILDLAKKAGANVPEPLAWIAKGRLYYSGWLLMREIEYQYSLAEAAKLPEAELLRTLDAFAEQVEILINARIYHLDLHPGNVLVGKSGLVFLIDFDKAKLFKGSLSDLRDFYLFRWRRAVIKHQLPELLSEKVCAALRASFSYRAV